MPKASLNGGHSPYAPGASGYFDEVTEDRKVRAACDRYLRQLGWTTHDSSTEERSSKADLSTIVSRANGSKADYFVSFHFNSSRDHAGHGAEVYYSPTSKSPWGKQTAAKVSAALAKLMGITDRGAKAQNFYVIKHTTMPAILIEVCFLDNKADADAYKRVGADAVGRCIAECIAGKAAASTTPAAAPSAPAAAPSSPAQSKLAVDGYWGTSTTTALQKALNTVADGEVWGQYSGNRVYLPNCTSGWVFQTNPSGSPVIRALQARIGATADGIMGANTVKALQRRHGVGADGVCGPKTVRALQTALNDGRL